MRGINPHIGLADVAVSGNVDLERGAGVKSGIDADAEDGVKVRRGGRSDVYRNDYGTINLATGKFEQSGQRDRCHPAHTSETHRHPEEEVLLRMISHD